MIYSTKIERFYPYMDSIDIEQLREYSSMSEMWQECSEKFADRIAIEDAGKKYSYRDVEYFAAAIRAKLIAAGCEKGLRVGLFAENSIDFVAGFIAITTLGAVAAVLPPHLPAQAVLGCSMQFGLKMLLCTPEKKGDTVLSGEKLGIPVICTDDVGEESVCAVACKAEEGCAIVFTGGTTGKSKGALLSNGGVMQGVMYGCLGIKGVFASRYLLCLPLSHVFGLIRNLLTSLSTGSTLFICRNNQDLFRDIAVFRPTILILVPALAEMALALSKKFRRNMLGDDLKTIICGAAAVPPYLIEEYDKFGISLYPGYGLTESSNLVSGNPDNIGRPDSVGLPFPNQELRVVEGELWLRGKNIMDGYIGAENENAFTEDGWFRTGDLVRFDEEGFLYITGRVKEIIVLPSGENISPAELEAHFLECILIQDCQVFEDIAEGGRHILALEVVPRAAEIAKLGESASAAIISELEKINASFPAFQRVSRIEIRDRDFERTKSMKIVRYQKCK